MAAGPWESSSRSKVREQKLLEATERKDLRLILARSEGLDASRRKTYGLTLKEEEEEEESFKALESLLRKSNLEEKAEAILLLEAPTFSFASEICFHVSWTGPVQNRPYVKPRSGLWPNSKKRTWSTPLCGAH